MVLDRRTFLQQVGLALFTLGATETGIASVGQNNQLSPLIQNYWQTLAQTTNRKLALLVGINQYPQGERLNGCLTDLELQTELLVHRFGFNPQDIITLSDRQATRENIETAFVEHLIEQAQADDVVVFHFSGYGGQVKMPLAIDGVADQEVSAADTYKLANSIIPVDGILSSKGNATANAVLEDTLLLLAQSLATNKSTMILDASSDSSPQQRRGNLKIRSSSKIAECPSSQALAFREQLRSKFSVKGLKPAKRSLSAPGVILSAAGKNQVAAEGHWDDFSAGLFTYALTQYLWQITPTSKVQVALERSAEAVERVMGKQQQPTINNPEKPSIAYYMTASNSQSAEAVVKAIANNNTVELKLIGYPPSIVNAYGDNSCLSLTANSDLDEEVWLQIKSRTGLTAKAQSLKPTVKPAKSIQVGQLLKEVIRVFERNLGLTIALDSDLQRIERVDATSALANTSAISSVVIAGEQHADCLLGALEVTTSDLGTTDTAEKSSDTLKSAPTYGLFSPGGVPIANAIGAVNESVKSAISRLSPQFNNLLAAKWIDLTTNDFSSGLPVEATLTLVSSSNGATFKRGTLSASTSTLESSAKSALPVASNNSIPVLFRGSEISFSLANNGDRLLYAILLGVDSDSNIFALYTSEKEKTEDATMELANITIFPQAQIVIPESVTSWKWMVSDSVGITQVYAIFATHPFEQTLAALATQQNVKLDREQVLNVPHPVEVAQALLQDLHTASAVAKDIIDPNANVYALNTNNWATLNFTYEVVNT